MSRKITKYSLCGIFLFLINLAATISFLIGCTSPGTRDLALYRVDVALLVDSLLALNPTTTQTNTTLLHPSLPNYWFIGTSGICDFFTDSPRLTAPGETKCRHAFPPNQNVLAVVEDSLRMHANNTDDIDATTAAWRETLDSIPSSRLKDKEAKVAAQNKASAGLAVLSLLLDMGCLPAAMLFAEERRGRVMVNLIALCSTVMAIAAGVCAVLSMNEGMHGVTSSVGNVSGSLVFLFIGAVIKLGWVELMMPRKVKLTHEQIGLLGEKFVYEWCESKIPGFSATNWSSKAHPDEQWKYADFTYRDSDGYMAEALGGAGVRLMPGWSRETTYHLEVKSTQEECDAVPFFVSPNQIGMMQRYNDDLDEAYIIVRVFRVGRKKVGVRFFPRPWDLKLRGVLEFGTPTAKGDTPVFIRS
ncbi:hypothetical protein OQA88_9162 [Cercophora sp. LCS_1]